MIVTTVKVCGRTDRPRRVPPMRSARGCGRRMAVGIVLAAMLTGGARAGEDVPVRVILYTRDTLTVRHPPVPVAGALADAIGSPSATLRQLIDLSLHHEDPAVRTEALRTAIGTLDTDLQLRSAVISELETADSALLTSLLRTAASERSEDIATQVLRDTRFPEIRLKASSVLQRLRSGS